MGVVVQGERGAREAVQTMDWGILIDEGFQDGVTTVYLVGQGMAADPPAPDERANAAATLRRIAGELDATPAPAHRSAADVFAVVRDAMRGAVGLDDRTYDVLAPAVLRALAQEGLLTPGDVVLRDARQLGLGVMVDGRPVEPDRVHLVRPARGECDAIDAALKVLGEYVTLPYAAIRDVEHDGFDGEQLTAELRRRDAEADARNRRMMERVLLAADCAGEGPRAEETPEPVGEMRTRYGTVLGLLASGEPLQAARQVFLDAHLPLSDAAVLRDAILAAKEKAYEVAGVGADDERRAPAAGGSRAGARGAAADRLPVGSEPDLVSRMIDARACLHGVRGANEVAMRSGVEGALRWLDLGVEEGLAQRELYAGLRLLLDGEPHVCTCGHSPGCEGCSPGFEDRCRFEKSLRSLLGVEESS